MGRLMLRTLQIILTVGLLTGCLPEPPPLPPESSDSPAAYRDADGTSGPDVENKELPPRPVEPKAPITPIKPDPTQPPAVTFTKDILPLLSSVEAGRIFKCTVCHRGYTDYETLAKPETLGRILPRVLPGGNMPLNGDKMSSKDIQLLLDWQNLGFPK